MKGWIIRQLEAEIREKTTEIKKITPSRRNLSLLLRDIKYPVDDDEPEVEEEGLEDPLPE